MILKNTGEYFEIVKWSSLEFSEIKKMSSNLQWNAKIKTYKVPYSFESLKMIYISFNECRIEWISDYEETNEEHILNFRKELTIRGYSNRTIKGYVNCLSLFEKFTNKSLDYIGEEDVKMYSLYLLKIKNVSHSYINQVINSIKLFYTIVLKNLTYASGLRVSEVVNIKPTDIETRDKNYSRHLRRKHHLLGYCIRQS